MAKDKNSFLLYTDFEDHFSNLTDEEAGKLIKHIFAYVNDRNPETDDRIIQIAFNPIKSILKRDLKKYEARCNTNKENAEKRWKEKNSIACNNLENNAIAYERIKIDAKHADSDNDSDNDNDIILLKKAGDFYESDKAFLIDFNKARKHYIKLDTEIATLTAMEKIAFREIQHTLTIEEIRTALQGMFEQKDIYQHSKIRPTHFLKNVELYRDAKRGNLQLFEVKSKKSDRL